MFNQNLILFRIFKLIFITVFCFGSILAQDKKEVTTTAVAVEEEPQILVAPALRREEEDDSKVTGATVRGRLIYEDTTRPLRYAMIALIGDKETYTTYGTKFVKTDENGEFVIKNVKPGTYVAFVKSEGVLNQDSYKFSYRQQTKDEKSETQFEKIEIAGLGEFQIVVAARRGGAISGRILYADGESAVGVKVEALRKEGSRYSNISSGYSSEMSIGRAQTDDRGAYRITGLPEGQYIIRVVEPVSHTQSSAQYLYNFRDNQNSILRTYYPEGENSKDAKELEISPGQEQAGIDITLPERQLFGISGKIIKKGSREPLANFTVNFYRVSGERDEQVTEYYGGAAATSNKSGEWSLKSLPKGKYRISISQGYVYNSEKDANKKQEQYPNLSKEIEITDGNLADVDFEVPGESALSGTITVEGGKEVPRDVRFFAANEESKQLIVSDYDYSRGKTQTATKEMSFRIGKMSEGKYRLVMPGNQNYYLKSATLGGKDLLNSPFEIKEGEDIKGVQIVISTNMGTVKGKVAGYDGKEDVFVVLMETNAVFGTFQARNFSTKLPPTGDFEIKAAPGDYSLVIIPMKSRPQTQEQYKEWFEKLIREGQKITVKDGQVANVSLTMPN